jgi:hypothetical protein
LRRSYDPFNPEIDRAIETDNPSSLTVGSYGLLRSIEIKSVNISQSTVILLLNAPLPRVAFDAQKELYLAPSPRLRERVKLKIYANALEEGCIVDILLRRQSTDYQGLLFWFTVQYKNEHLRSSYGQTREMTLKPDALFAYRLGHSQKAVRFVVRRLLTLGHLIPSEILTEKIVTIDYARGRDRAYRPDIHCIRCSRRFEVKSRTDDFYYRFSHSDRRPFWSENAPEDYNILVFPDWHMEAFQNADLQSIIQNLTPEATERYDTFVQLTTQQADRIRLSDDDLRCKG